MSKDFKTDFKNVSSLLTENASRHPQKLATILENQRSLTFEEMEDATRRNVSQFLESGIQTGDRVATFVRPSLDFVPVIFALFRIGAVPVFIDPGMSVPNMLKCIEQSECRVMIGIPLAFVLRRMESRYFKHVDISLCLSDNGFTPFVLGAKQLRKAKSNPFLPSNFIAPVTPHQLAAILFTSGSTGIPKGVEVTFGILWKQQEMLRSAFHIQDDEIDLVPFPLFALFSAAWGITSVIPAMDPAKPAKCDGKALFELMLREKVTHTAGSPAIWKNVLDYALTSGKKLPELKRVLMAGAPVSEKLIRGWQSVLSENGNVFTPYGATEALPLTFISDRELIDHCYDRTARGQGSCVGKALNGIQIKIIAVSDSPISDISEVKELPQNSIGEILVKGDIVTARYYGNNTATLMAKVRGKREGESQNPNISNQNLWHRMGDLGYLDAEGRLWFCGRKDHRIKQGDTDLYPAALEAIFNQVEGVSRTALVGVPSSQSSDKPILLIEGKDSKKMLPLKELLLSKAQEHEATKSIKSVMVVKQFPTDVRHNIKINRSLLAINASKKLGRHHEGDHS